MGLFGKRDKEAAYQAAEDIGAGRGLQGKLLRGLMGAEVAGQVGAAAQAARSAETAAMAMSSGVATVPATVLGIVDTGQLVNFDPMVMLTLQFADGQQLQLQTVVSKLQVPRVGDTVALIDNPAQPGSYAYAGLASA
ncbi:hypothetical protein [Cellulomonas sp. NPDC089187]|uniref:hypothetical protein n=1 Tax=Cellulomonas sp. NPDC089187 TaxID=3154970 RepID=UPI003425431E